MKLALLGSTGLLGQALLSRVPPQISLISLPRSVDIGDLTALEAALAELKPDAIVNAVAYNDVDGAETHPELAFRVNAQGPSHLADVGAKLGVPIIHFSTDYVFSDALERPFTEEDPSAPLSVYGKSKKAGEEGVRTWKRHYILRTSALYGKGRPNHALRILDSFKTKEPLQLASDLFCSPTYVRDLADWTVALILKKPAYGTYHLCHKGAVSRYAFAQRLAGLLSEPLPHPFKPVLLKDLRLAAPRPSKPLLSVEKWEKTMGPLPSWGDGLERFLKDL